MFKFLAKKIAKAKVLTDVDSVINACKTYQEVSSYLEQHPRIIEYVYEELWYLMDGSGHHIQPKHLDRFALLVLCLPKSHAANEYSLPQDTIIQVMNHLIVLEDGGRFVVGRKDHLLDAHEAYLRFLSVQKPGLIKKVFNPLRAGYVRRFVRGFYEGWARLGHEDMRRNRQTIFGIDYRDYDRMFAAIIEGVENIEAVKDILSYAVFPLRRSPRAHNGRDFGPYDLEDYVDLLGYPIPTKCFSAMVECYRLRDIIDIVEHYVRIIWRSHIRQDSSAGSSNFFSPLRHLVPNLDWETEKRVLALLHVEVGDDWERVYGWAGERKYRIDLMCYTLDLLGSDKKKRSDILIKSCFVEMITLEGADPNEPGYIIRSPHHPYLYLAADVIIAFVEKVGRRTSRYAFTRNWYWFGNIGGDEGDGTWFENYLFLEFLARKVCYAPRRVRRIATQIRRTQQEKEEATRHYEPEVEVSYCRTAVNLMMHWYGAWLLKHPEVPGTILKKHIGQYIKTES